MITNEELMALVGDLADRTEILEAKVREQGMYIERMRRNQLPSKAEIQEDLEFARSNNVAWMLTREEQYIFWGEEHVRKVWRQDPAPHAASLANKRARR